jgi:single-stranded-DNA-specific exonuclease
VAFFPQVNEFRGSRTVQLLVTDLRRSLSSEQRELRLYRRCVAGELLSAVEVQRLLPQRRDFVALWRYLDQAGGESGIWEAPEVLSRNVSRWAEVPLGCAATMVCLEVFRERGLIELTVEEHSVRARILPTSNKVNLNESPLLLRLRSALDN